MSKSVQPSAVETVTYKRMGQQFVSGGAAGLSTLYKLEYFYVFDAYMFQDWWRYA